MKVDTLTFDYNADISGVCYNCLNGFHKGCDDANCKCRETNHKSWWWKNENEERIPSTPLDLDQLDRKVKKEIEGEIIVGSISFAAEAGNKFTMKEEALLLNGLRAQWVAIKPLLSSMLQGKVSEGIFNANMKGYEEGIKQRDKEISFLKLQVRVKEQRIKELETELSKILKDI